MDVHLAHTDYKENVNIHCKSESLPTLTCEQEIVIIITSNIQNSP